MVDESDFCKFQSRLCHVSGRVQGVYFRGSTKKQAQSLGLRGSACNLPDGRVEVIMYGSTQSLDSLENWLWQGPQFAMVSHVQCTPIELESIPDGFDIG